MKTSTIPVDRSTTLSSILPSKLRRLPLGLVPPVLLDRLKLKLGKLNTSLIVLQLTLYFIPWLYLANTGRCAGQNQITGLGEGGVSDIWIRWNKNSKGDGNSPRGS